MVRIVDEYFPMVFALVHGEVTSDDIDGMYSEYERIHLRKQRFYLVQEVRQVKLPGAVLRKRLAELNDHFASDIGKHVVGIGVVVPNRLIAGALRAVYWMSKEYAPTRFHSTCAEMFDQAAAQCSAENVSLPAEARAWLDRLDDQFVNGGMLTEVDLP